MLGTSVMYGSFDIVGSEVLVPDPELDLSEGVDVPTWREGDHWNYTTSFEITYLVFDIPFTGWMNMSLVHVALDLTYENSPVYVVNITGNMTGKYDNDLLGIHERIYVDIKGYIWYRVQDLSMYRMITNATISGTQDSLNGHHPFGYEYSPPLEEFDLPLIPGEHWNVNVSARAMFGTSGDEMDLDYNNSCSQPEYVDVPAGTFYCFPVLTDGSPTHHYNATVGNSVKRTLSMTVEGISIEAPFELETYQHAEEETVIRIEVDEDQPVWAGEQFTVSGELTVSDTVVTLFFPGGEIAAYKTLLGGQKKFSHTLTAPDHTDDTETEMDHGSFGILAVEGGMSELDVCTVTTKAVDLELVPASIDVSPLGNGTIDDAFTFDIMVKNPSNFGVMNFSLRLQDSTLGTELFIWNGLSLQAREELYLSEDLFFDIPGEHDISLTVDPEDRIREINESNNFARTLVNVSERPPLVWETDPSPGNLTVPEGDPIDLSARAYRGDASLPPVTWSLEEETLVEDHVINLTTNFTGMLSSSGSPYRISCRLDPEYLFQGENGTLWWNLHIADRDRPPSILSFSPNSTHMEIMEGEEMEFSVVISDPDMEPVEIEWTIDGEVKPWKLSTFLFCTNYTGKNSSEMSPFNITVIGSDPDNPTLLAVHSWNITVIDVDRDPHIRVDPEPGNLSMSWNSSVYFELDLIDPDGDPAALQWYVEDVPVSNSSYLVFSPSELGLSDGREYGIILSITAGSWNGTYCWTVMVEENIPEPEDEGPVPPSGVKIISPVEGRSYVEGDPIELRAAHSDSRYVIFTWYVNGSVYSGPNVTLEGLVPGNYSLLLNASAQGPSSGTRSLETWFLVVEHGDPPPVKEEDDGSFWWLYLFIALVVLGILAAAAFIALSGGRDEEQWEG